MRRIGTLPFFLKRLDGVGFLTSVKLAWSARGQPSRLDRTFPAPARPTGAGRRCIDKAHRLWHHHPTISCNDRRKRVLMTGYFDRLANIKGKVAVLVGGGDGVGRGVSLALAEAGCDLAIC